MLAAKQGPQGQCLRCLIRTLHTTPITLLPEQQVYIPPESPAYIDIPRRLEYHPYYKRRIRGRLPIPRDLTRKRGPRPGKRPSELTDAIPTPTRIPDTQHDRHDPLLAERITDQRAASANRRRNLVEGFEELRTRKAEKITQMKEKHDIRNAEVRALRDAPQRDDELFTESSVSPLLKHQPGRLPDPDRMIRIAIKAQNQAIHATKLAAERRAHLHTLYTRARHFITTEQQLAKQLDEVFVPNPAHWTAVADGFGRRGLKGQNVWSRGAPLSISQMMNERKREIEGSLDGRRETMGAGPGRMKRLRELVTGGTEAGSRKKELEEEEYGEFLRKGAPDFDIMSDSLGASEVMGVEESIEVKREDSVTDDMEALRLDEKDPEISPAELDAEIGAKK